MEIWHDHFRNIIPKEDYVLLLEHGERHGLRIRLEGENHHAALDFGNVQAVHILDEGTLLNEHISNQEQLRNTNFSSTLYLVENGAYGVYIKTQMGPEIYRLLDLHQYDLVTMNYVVEIITAFEPIITIRKS